MKKILSIDGGGIKGVFPASFLATVEDAIRRNVADYFDLIVGTSTGGIIALGLGLGLSAKEILKFYEDHSPNIFKGNRGWRFLRHIGISKYDALPLKTALEEVFKEAGRKPQALGNPIVQSRNRRSLHLENCPSRAA